MTCRHCRFSYWNGVTLMCVRTGEYAVRVCESWEREPGADDDK